MGFSVIGMTNVPEFKLAREAEICYASVALVTGRDVWHEEPVTVEMVIGSLNANTADVKAALEVRRSPMSLAVAAANAPPLRCAILTDRQRIPAKAERGP